MRAQSCRSRAFPFCPLRIRSLSEVKLRHGLRDGLSHPRDVAANGLEAGTQFLRWLDPLGPP
jgi:hypothetical protein